MDHENNHDQGASACRQSRACCHMESDCPREEISRLITPETTFSDQVSLAAARVAHSCTNLSEPELRTCFSRLFAIPPECRLGDEFVQIYEDETVKLGAGDREIGPVEAG